MTKYKITKPVLGEFGIYLFGFLIGIITFLVVYFIAKENGIMHVVSYYQTNMRGSMFTGFLTAGSFLLSLKTGIVIKIKETVYDKEAYQLRVSKAIEGGSDVTFYGPLKRLSRVLSAAVFSALVASALQLTLGLRMEWQAMAICLAFASTAFSLLISAFVLIQIILRSWFDSFDADAKATHQKRLQTDNTS